MKIEIKPKHPNRTEVGIGIEDLFVSAREIEVLGEIHLTKIEDMKETLGIRKIISIIFVTNLVPIPMMKECGGGTIDIQMQIDLEIGIGGTEEISGMTDTGKS